MMLRSRTQNKQDQNNELGLIINNITYPYQKYQYRYFAQSNILIYQNCQVYEVWNVQGEQLLKNDNLKEFMQKFERVVYFENNDKIIGLNQNLCQIYDLSKQQIINSPKLYQSIQNQPRLITIGCYSKLENVLCIGHKKILQFWNIKQGKQTYQQFLKFNVSLLEQKQYIMIQEGNSNLYQLFLTLSKQKLLRRLKFPQNGHYHKQTFNGKNLMIDQFVIMQQTLSLKQFVIDITSMKIRKIIHHLDDLCIDQIHIEKQDILVQLFKDKIKIYNKEYTLIYEKIVPYRKINNTCPQKLEYNEQQGLIIFHSKYV